MGLTSPCSTELDEVSSETDPNPLNKTFANDLFIALHMIFVKISPLAPTKAPATINTLFSITKPAAQAAKPEKLFNKAMTTGISAPPIGITKRTPRTIANPQRINKVSLAVNIC